MYETLRYCISVIAPSWWRLRYIAADLPFVLADVTVALKREAYLAKVALHGGANEDSDDDVNRDELLQSTRTTAAASRV